MKFIINKLNNDYIHKVNEIIINNWGSDIIASMGKVYKLQDLDGFIALSNKDIVGVITYNIKNKKCQIITLNSLIENKGIGSGLIEEVIKESKKNNCKILHLVTTNDNIKAIKFYQKKGFDIRKIYFNSIKKYRKIKQEIPEIGDYEIPIKHEIEFIIKL